MRSMLMRGAAAMLATCGLADAAMAETAGPLPVEHWIAYGTDTTFERAAGVPGGNDLSLASRAGGGDPWSSAAGLPLPLALAKGERVTASFWARAATPVDVPVTIQGGAPAYTAIASETLHLTPAWRRVSLSGVAPAALAAGSQSLTVQTGRVPATVALGPVLFATGAASPGATDRAFADFRPGAIVEDVSIASEPGVTLAGRLHRPSGAARVPAVVLIAGNGAAPRGLYPLLVERLAAAGIAALDYDKRGVGRSTGAFVDTVPLMERDAAAAVAWLRARRDIDPRRIAVLGTSQGGLVAPGVAAADPDVAAVVMLAGPAGKRGDLFLDEMRGSLLRGGTRPDGVEPILAATRPFMDAHAANASAAALAPLQARLTQAFVAGGHGSEKAAGFVAMLGDPVVVSLYDTPAAETLAKVKAPVLALYAGDDIAISTGYSIPEAKAALANNPDATVREMPHVSHTFQPTGPNARSAPARVVPILSDPASLEVVSDWLVAHLRK